MLHKPAGVLSATEDGRGETVLDLLAPEYRKIGLFPVGRLDKDTEGLLLLTDDGALAHDLLAPKRHVDKVYFARTDGALTAEDCAAFAAGIKLCAFCQPDKDIILSSSDICKDFFLFSPIFFAFFRHSVNVKVSLVNSRPFSLGQNAHLPADFRSPAP